MGRKTLRQTRLMFCHQCKLWKQKRTDSAVYCSNACKMKAYRRRVKRGVWIQSRGRRRKAAKRRHPRRA